VTSIELKRLLFDVVLAPQDAKVFCVTAETRSKLGRSPPVSLAS